MTATPASTTAFTARTRLANPPAAQGAAMQLQLVQTLAMVWME